MPGRGRKAGKGADGDRRSGLGGAGADIVQLIVDYAKQETLGPLKALGKFVLFGLGGSLLLALGALMLLLALLRLLQEETGPHLTGHWSWAPYLITFFVGVVIMGVAVWRIAKGAGARRARDEKGRA